MINKAGREIPEFIEGYGIVKPFDGAYTADIQNNTKVSAKIQKISRGGKERKQTTKICSSIGEVIEKVGLKSGMTVSFHHHLRNGDQVTNMVMEAIALKGLRDIKVAASGLFQCHDPLANLIDQGVITGITLSTISKGQVAERIVEGKLKTPAVFMTHGGRARAIEAGDLHIDVAFIAAPACDTEGNANGCMGPSACGVLSFAKADAQFADKVVIITDNLMPYPLCPAEINQTDVDYIVKVDSIGDPKGIVFGPTKISTDQNNLAIARRAAEVISATGYIRNGMSFQTGVGGISLAVASEVAGIMKKQGVVGSFMMGGITAPIVEMLHERLFKTLLDGQCFDTTAIASIRNDPCHMAIGISQYANPQAKSCVVDQLDVMILGATEIDLDFNVNVVTGSDGKILSAAGGNSDCAAGAKIAIVVSKLTKGKFCFIRNKVTTVVTPGETVDVLVTDYGIAVNPRRQDLLQKLNEAGIETIRIENMKKLGDAIVGPESATNTEDTIVGIVEYRDGSVIDVVRKISKELK